LIKNLSSFGISSVPDSIGPHLSSSFLPLSPSTPRPIQIQPRVSTSRIMVRMIGPLVAVTSRAALYPIQSIIIIALIVSGAYFHLLDIARNPPDSSVAGSDLYRGPSDVVAPSLLTMFARREASGWKWTAGRPDVVQKDVTFAVHAIANPSARQPNYPRLGSARCRRAFSKRRFPSTHTANLG
jgi:hypothetical protein